jgi:hypothetical protein
MIYVGSLTTNMKKITQNIVKRITKEINTTLEDKS